MNVRFLSTKPLIGSVIVHSQADRHQSTCWELKKIDSKSFFTRYFLQSQRRMVIIAYVQASHQSLETSTSPELILALPPVGQASRAVHQVRKY
jgi:hypothetical protein